MNRQKQEMRQKSWWHPMAKPTGFLEFHRELPIRRPVNQRVGDWLEVYEKFPEGN